MRTSFERLPVRVTDGLAVLLSVVCAIRLLYEPVEFPSAGLDPSWKYASEYAYRTRLIFGRDFVFTSGPLSFVSTGLFHPDTFPWIVIAFGYGMLVYVAAVWWSDRRWLAAL